MKVIQSETKWNKESPRFFIRRFLLSFGMTGKNMVIQSKMK